MATVVEDGTGKPDATSLLALGDIRAYATARGRTLPEDDAELEILVTLATDYMKSREDEYSGELLKPGIQALSWPRTGQYIYGVVVPDGTIPVEAKNYQCQLIMAANAGIVLFPTVTSDTRNVKRKKVGPLETEWFDAGPSGGWYSSGINAALLPLLGAQSGYPLTVRRI